MGKEDLDHDLQCIDDSLFMTPTDHIDRPATAVWNEEEFERGIKWAVEYKARKQQEEQQANELFDKEWKLIERLRQSKQDL